MRLVERNVHVQLRVLGQQSVRTRERIHAPLKGGARQGEDPLDGNADQLFAVEHEFARALVGFAACIVLLRSDGQQLGREFVGAARDDELDVVQRRLEPIAAQPRRAAVLRSPLAASPIGSTVLRLPFFPRLGSERASLERREEEPRAEELCDEFPEAEASRKGPRERLRHLLALSAVAERGECASSGAMAPLLT